MWHYVLIKVPPRVLRQAWSRGSWPDGTCSNTLVKRTMPVSVTSEAAADLNLTTSGPWLRSWPPRRAPCLRALRSTASGAVAWRCTQSPGSELGTGRLSPHVLIWEYVQVWLLNGISLCRARRDYWENLKPASGRPFCPAMANPSGWGVTKGHADLMQQKEATSKDQLKVLFDKSNKSNWAPLWSILFYRKKLREGQRTVPEVYKPKRLKCWSSFFLFRTFFTVCGRLVSCLNWIVITNHECL